MRRSVRGLAAVAAIGGSAAAMMLASGASAASRARDFRWFEPAPAPASWERSVLPGGGAMLFHPTSLGPVRHDKTSISFGRTDSSGRVLVYLNAAPRQGAEQLATWPAFRIMHNRDESSDVRELGQASGLTFIGGTGSCVLDDYVTRVKVNHYREIACFVQGSGASGVVVAAALRSQWTHNASLLERAIESYQLG